MRGDLPPTRHEVPHDDATPTQAFDAVDAAATRVVSTPDAAVTRVVESLSDDVTRVIGTPDTAVTRVVSGPDAATTPVIGVRDAAETRVVARDAAGTQPLGPDDAAPTMHVDPAIYGKSPHGNRLGPQLRRLPAELAARYRSLRDLRGGSQADVVVAEERTTGREVVIKLYRMPGDPYDAATRARLDQADPSYVVTVLERGSSDGYAWEVQEYCQHGTLLEAPELLPLLSDERFHTVVTQLGGALVHLHGLSIVHRDLKPANVLVRSTAPLDLVLTDFGLSTEMAMSMDVGTIAGTFPYMPPEAHYGEIGRAGDWWALGVIAYTLLSGRHFLADSTGRLPNDAKLRHAIATGDYVLERVGNDRQWLLLRGLLTRNRKARWGSAQFREWLAGGSPTVVPDAPPAPAAPAPELPRTVVAAPPMPPATRVMPQVRHAPQPIVSSPMSPPAAPVSAPQAPSPSPEQAQPEVNPAKIRRLVRRAAERAQRQQWRQSFVGRTIGRFVWAGAWCLAAGLLMIAATILSGSLSELQANAGDVPAMFGRYAPAALIAVGVATLAETLFLRRQWPNRMLGLTAAVVGLQGSFSDDGVFLGLPTEVPLYFIGGWTFSLLMGWLTALLGQTHPNGVPLTRFDSNRQRSRLARFFLPLAHLSGAVAGGMGLASWFFSVVPFPGGADAVIERIGVFTSASRWLDRTIPQIDILGLANDPIHLTMFGLLAYLLMLTANDLQRLAPSLIWVGIVGSLLAAVIIVFAVPALLPLAVVPSLIALITIRWTERSTPPPLAAPGYMG
ncbi:protein kinase domain-containing protein [Tessaracoccus caeni]|uniref:protein kinase domain-containing protein n=1 Tax=Tessaracoccus caeni TaxID=3031239 RepID=UPI0023DBC395|nr:protein kinase [Tessaracoccus caeni]MDF1489352.1 protein kinase [Tessaracoccus caeni]